jgi:hypothetical protein
MEEEEKKLGVVKNKILIDNYHHLLETLLSLFPQVNKRLILPIFS